MVTRRCTQRKFLLTPSRASNNAVIYCLAVAAELASVNVMLFIAMSNHLHELLFDRDGNLVQFYEHFHRLLAKCMNAHLGRWENFFSSEQTNVVRCETREDILGALVYIATNPVAADLVENTAQWPGANGIEALLTGEPLRATRPTFYFDPDGEMPDEVELYLRVPPELGDHDAFIADLRRGIAQAEAEEKRKRDSIGRKVVGRNKILRQHWDSSPTSHEPRRNMRPSIKAIDIFKRLEAIQRRRDFLRLYRLARQALISGTPIPFPHGTYWLKRFMNVEVDSAEKMN
jgi:hypothetical protein